MNDCRSRQGTQIMGIRGWSRTLWLFAFALPIGAGLMAFGAVPFIRGLGAFVLADAVAGVILCALALRVLYPGHWRSRWLRLSAQARGAQASAQRLASSASGSPETATVG